MSLGVCQNQRLLETRSDTGVVFRNAARMHDETFLIFQVYLFYLRSIGRGCCYVAIVSSTHPHWFVIDQQKTMKKPLRLMTNQN